MTVHPDVIRDLLPLYVAGEASAATRALVEERLAADPALARLAAEASALDGRIGAGAEAAAPSAGTERRAFSETRRLLRLRSWLLGLALTATLMPLSFEFDAAGLHFLLLENAPAVASLSLAAGIGLWIAYARVSRRLRVTGL